MGSTKDSSVQLLLDPLQKCCRQQWLCRDLLALSGHHHVLPTCCFDTVELIPACMKLQHELCVSQNLSRSWMREKVKSWSGQWQPDGAPEPCRVAYDSVSTLLDDKGHKILRNLLVTPGRWRSSLSPGGARVVHRLTLWQEHALKLLL